MHDYIGTMIEKVATIHDVVHGIQAVDRAVFGEPWTDKNRKQPFPRLAENMSRALGAGIGAVAGSEMLDRAAASFAVRNPGGFIDNMMSHRYGMNLPHLAGLGLGTLAGARLFGLTTGLPLSIMQDRLDPKQ